MLKGTSPKSLPKTDFLISSLKRGGIADIMLLKSLRTFSDAVFELNTILSTSLSIESAKTVFFLQKSVKR